MQLHEADQPLWNGFPVTSTRLGDIQPMPLLFWISFCPRALFADGYACP
jgi:hypothetical protein